MGRSGSSDTGLKEGSGNVGKKSKGQKEKKKRKGITGWVYEKIWRPKGSQFDRRMVAKLRMLHPVSEQELSRMVREYRMDQIKLVLLGIVVFFGFLAGILIYLFLPKDPIVIERNSYGEGEKEETVYPKNQDPISFSVQEQEYTDEELEKVFQEGFVWVKENMMEKNKTAAEVRSDLNFMTEVPSGLAAEWVPEDTDIIQEDGTVLNENWEEGQSEFVGVTLILSYGTQKQQQELHFTVKAPILSEAEKLQRKIYNAIVKKEEETRTESTFTLPFSIEGVTLEQSQSGSQIPVLGIMIVTVFVFLLYRKQGKLKEQLEGRQREILEDYPKIVNQLVLYLGAGMNLKAAFERIVIEHQEDKKIGITSFRYAYQELYVMMNEMRAGVSERQAYEAYGTRMGESCYIKLMALIVQNLQKGNSGLLKALAEEEENAFAKRISQAKTLGEEAGTKLLFPMIVLLVVVMAIVMLPAIFQFQNY